MLSIKLASSSGYLVFGEGEPEETAGSLGSVRLGTEEAAVTNVLQ